jgi:protein TonB
MFSSVEPSLPSEFALRQEEIQDPSTSGQAESKPDLKKMLSKTPEQVDPSEIVRTIQPALPTENKPVGLELQIPPDSGVDAQSTGPSPTPKTEVVTLPETPVQAPSQPAAKPGGQAALEKPKPGDLVALESVDIQPALIKRINPKYPLQALQMGVSGTLTVNALISETGDVLRTEILKGIKGGYGFERSAETAVRQWKFRPAEKGGVPVRVWKSFEINFKLGETRSP